MHHVSMTSGRLTSGTTDNGYTLSNAYQDAGAVVCLEQVDVRCLIADDATVRGLSYTMDGETSLYVYGKTQMRECNACHSIT